MTYPNPTTASLLAPGLNRIRRACGRVDLYWIASRAARKAGFKPATVKIPPEYDEFEAAFLCRQMQVEQSEWMLTKQDALREAAKRGTLAWLCTQFETDPDSPFREKREATRSFYRKNMQRLVADHGDEFLADLAGRDVRRWHREWRETAGDRTAYACIQTLRRVVKYGVADLGYDPCVKLSRILTETTFQQPASRKRRADYPLVVAFRKAAHEAGHPSLALAVTLQFELGLRQRDVIGEWTQKLPRGFNRYSKRQAGRALDGWDWGLTWSHIDASTWHLIKPTSKSNGREVAEHVLTAYPELMAELMRVPGERRVGPIVINEATGLPWTEGAFRRHFRALATKAGWPADVWNMDSRAGAVSESFEAGADPADVMKTATHKQLSTTMLYNRGGHVQTSRVAALRIAGRETGKKNGS